jgi:hypothetical protein
MANKDLHNAKKVKNDEFYTQLSDIEKECRHYKVHFKGKIIFCNCDDPYESEFFKYFALNFNHLGLKKLLASCYIGSPIANTQLSLFDFESAENKTTKSPHKIEITEMADENAGEARGLPLVEYLLRNRKNVLTRLQGDGDFRSDECVEMLKEADIVVTNPPFSLFREYIAQLMEYGKKFLIIGNVNAISYKEIFPLFKYNKIWMGPSIHSGDREFILPKNFIVDENRINAHNYRVDEKGNRYLRVMGIRWFTNLDVSTRHEKLDLYKKYTPEEYPHYDNYDAIEIGKVAEIPADWDGAMGVPVSFLDKYNPDQFDILGLSASAGYDAEIVGIPKYEKFKDARPLINGKNTYARILIKRKQNEN